MKRVELVRLLSTTMVDVAEQPIAYATLATLFLIVTRKRPVPAAPTSNVLSVRAATTGNLLRAARLVPFVYPRSTKPQRALLLLTRTVFALLVKILLIAVYQRPVQPVPTMYVLSVPVDITSPVRRAAWLVPFVYPRSTKPQRALLPPTRTVFAHLVKILLIAVWQRPVRVVRTSNVLLASLTFTEQVRLVVWLARSALPISTRPQPVQPRRTRIENVQPVVTLRIAGFPKLAVAASTKNAKPALADIIEPLLPVVWLARCVVSLNTKPRLVPLLRTRTVSAQRVMTSRTAVCLKSVPPVQIKRAISVLMSTTGPAPLVV